MENVFIAIDSSNINFAMRGFLIKCFDKSLYILGSDGEFSIKSEIKQDDENLFIEKEGEFLVSSSIIRNIIKKSDGFIEFELEGKNLKITNGLDQFSINLWDKSDYPNIEFSKHGIQFEMDIESFKNIIKNVSFAAATSESTAKVLHYINLSHKSDFMKVTATDSYRVASEMIEIKCNEEFDVSLPVKSLKRISNSEISGQVKVYIDDLNFSFEKDGEILQIKMFDGIYKDINNVFPKESEIKYVLEISKKEMNDLLSKAAFSTSDKYNRVKMFFSKDSFSISSVYEELGTSKVFAKNFKWKGEDLVVTLNYRFLKDAISVFEDEVAIFFNERVDRILVLSKSNPRNKQLVTPHRG